MNDSQALEHLRAHLLASADAQRRTAEACGPQIVGAARMIASALQAGGKSLADVLLNGSSGALATLVCSFWGC